VRDRCATALRDIYNILRVSKWPVLRFALHQLHIQSLGRYYLPLPKLTEAQLKQLSAHLEARGFSVRPGSGSGRRVAVRGHERIAIDGTLGLAGSGADLLDALAPAVPGILASPRGDTGGAARYYSLKRTGAAAVLQFFPRLESLRVWTYLRREGTCGLTPDEAAVLRHLLGKASGSSQIRCVTATPKMGSRPLQVGRRVYYESDLPVREFLASLRTIDSGERGSASYLPRGSVLEVPGVRVDTSPAVEEVGEWCYL
jgi:hypothetical protein